MNDVPSIRDTTLQLSTARPGERVKPAADRPPGSSEDALRITAFAEALQAIESDSSEEGMVNSDKIGDVRQAVARGAYKISANRIALKFLSFEMLLYGGQR